MSKSPFSVFSHAWRLLLITSLLGTFLAILFSFVAPLQYSSSVRVFVTQPTATNLDPYTASKATERIAATLSELVYSTTFLNNALDNANQWTVNGGPILK